MATEVLEFIFNFNEPLYASISLVKEASEKAEPEDRSKLDDLQKALIFHKEITEDFANLVTLKYFDASEESILAFERMVESGEKLSPDSHGVPPWAKLNNLEDPERLIKVWNEIQMVNGALSEHLKRFRRLQREIFSKAGITLPNTSSQALIDSLVTEN
jgi:hypothetical protein